MQKITIAVIQMAFTWDIEDNLLRAGKMVRFTVEQGAHIILLPELFQTPYFCKDQDPIHYDLAFPLNKSRSVEFMRSLAAECQVVLPVSFFEKAGPAYFNSVAIIDADGKILGVYRKSHIPAGPGYQEKFYFSPGDTGFQVWNTRYACIGVGICWDQWFPECARAMVLQGAEVLLYPTAIGSEPPDPTWDSSGHWQRVMQGHAAANIVPVAAANRFGYEKGNTAEITFYGSSFIADPTGDIVQNAGRDTEETLIYSFDLSSFRRMRAGWGLFRDRRPELYGCLMRLDGTL